ncbi:PP2C family protein-serine/threonine phosphatase [Kitasatospora sp. CB02891]|uniref:PP2C family protein-serine/threonine phosphatase n=1 Tax=Kitasatospora sp. CB02891 TaxID=2020329 RepID=UPI000C275F65|nr:PP2C family protein-serine/threonine phosphatase [Kitasatospora sp. CB02891]PJN27005.1 serine/threonine protein phosphatase [Kitasatospora sp. CB02891]
MPAPTAAPVRVAPGEAAPGQHGRQATARWEAAMAEALRTPTWVRVLPILLLVADLVLEESVPRSVAAGFLLTVLPVVVAFSAGPAVVAGATALTVGLQALLALRAGHLYEQHHLWTYLGTVLAGVMGAGLARQRRCQARDLVRMRAVADTLQHTVLHPVPARVGGLRAAGLYRPAEADVGIGGDLYDVCETRYGTRILLGDVRGKGLEAVRTVADVVGAFRIAAHETADLGELAAQLDRQVGRAAEDRGDGELFVTAVLVQHDRFTGRFELVNRGHLDPLVVGPGTVAAVRCAEDLPLGLGHLAAGPAAAPTAVSLPAGHSLLLHTDGVTEARDGDGEFYPLAARLGTLPITDPDTLVAFLAQDVRRHAGALTDDVAVLALRAH